jgi:hypothetical protein
MIAKLPVTRVKAMVPVKAWVLSACLPAHVKMLAELLNLKPFNYFSSSTLITSENNHV